MRRSRLRPRSAKAAIEAVERRRLVAEHLRLNPVCVYPGCGCDAADVHEPLTRARGGSIDDPSNMIGLCRRHHDYVHTHPAEAERAGLLRHSWER